MGQEHIHPEIFNFMYQIIVLTAFSEKWSVSSIVFDNKNEMNIML